MANSANGGCPIRKVLRKKKDNPLIIAYLEGDFEKAYAMILKGESKELYYVIFREACKKNHIETVKLLLENKLVDVHDGMAFLKACERGFEDIVDVFLSYSTDMSKYSKYGLYYASANKHYSIVKKWFEHGTTAFERAHCAMTSEPVFDYVLERYGYAPFVEGNEIAIVPYSHSQEHGMVKLISKGYQTRIGSRVYFSEHGLFDTLTAQFTNLISKKGLERYVESFNYPTFLREYKLTPVKALELLDKDNLWHQELLPMFLARYFNKNKTTPLRYIKRCPEWQKPYVLSLMV